MYEIYCKLVEEIPNDCNHLFGGTFAEEDEYWLSIDAHAQPHILFKSTTDYDGRDLKLKFIDVEFSRDCEILIHGSIKYSGVFTVIRLNENDPDLVRIFLRLLEEILCKDSRKQTNKNICKQILELSNLFSLVEIDTKDIIGLWGELYVIKNAKNLENAAMSWCQHKMAKFDFVATDYALEVKSTFKSTRMHNFSLEQIRPAGGFTSFIVSLLLVELSSGRRISDLMDLIYDSITDIDLRQKFFLQCLEKGGRNIYGSEMKIGVFPNDASIAVYDSTCIPVPIVGPEDPISGLRFDVDLSKIQTITNFQRYKLLNFI